MSPAQAVQRSLNSPPLDRPKVLIVDDNPTNVELIQVQLKPFQYEIQKAYGGEEALEIIKKDPPDLVLLDLMMPRISGYDVCKAIKSNSQTQLIPVIIVTALKELDDKIRAIELGADDFLMKPYNKVELVTRVKSLLRMKELYDDLDSSENVVFTLVQALEAKDIYTRGHSDRVAKYSVLLGRELGLGPQELEDLRRGGLLHDIGKVGVRESVLNKESKLDADEMAHVRSHPERGFEICKRLKSFKRLLPIIRSHHERIDGKGHPDGLMGDQIPLSAKICSITDTFDAMTSNRPYRRGITALQAANILEREVNSGQWDNDLLKIFIKLIHKNLAEK